MRETKVTVEQSADGEWWVSCDEVPGFYACGDTRKEALENAKEAISMYLGLEQPLIRLKIVKSVDPDDAGG